MSEKIVLVFYDDWEKGGKYGRRRLNDKRRVDTGEGESYFEFRIGEDIAKCDIGNENILDKRLLTQWEYISKFPVVLCVEFCFH